MLSIIRAKIDQRMEATRKLGGESPGVKFATPSWTVPPPPSPPPPPHTHTHTAWLPRLERLAELRKLDQFESNVLLILTGSMVSRNLRNSGEWRGPGLHK